MVQDIIINGLINGSIYALLAIGFSLIFGVARLVNIAHTAFYMVATYLLYIGLNLLGISAILSLVASVLLTIYCRPDLLSAVYKTDSRTRSSSLDRHHSAWNGDTGDLCCTFLKATILAYRHWHRDL